MNNFNLTKYLSKNLLLEDDRESMINHYAHKLAAGEEVSDEFFFDNEATIRDAADAIEKWSNSDADMDEAQMPKKMTRNQLKELIKSAYLEEDDDVGLQDEYTVDFNEAKKDKDEDKEEVEDDVTIDDTEDINIEAPAPASDSEFIASLESLKQQAESLNDPKLIRLLNNTITYYTRNHIVDDESDTMGLAEALTNDDLIYDRMLDMDQEQLVSSILSFAENNPSMTLEDYLNNEFGYNDELEEAYNELEENDMAFIKKLEATLNESTPSKNKRIMKESLEILKMKKLAGLLSEGQYSRALLREMGEINEEMKIFDLKDQNDASTELFKIENFTTVEEAIAALESYLGGKGLYTKATGAGYNYAYVASDGSVTFVKSLGEFSDGYQTEEEWGVASSKSINEINEGKLPTIKISKDIYYFDKLGRLDTKDNVDEKYHDKANLVFKKGQTVKDDTKYEDSDYKMITSSKSLKKGIDYISQSTNLKEMEGDSFDYSNLVLGTINQLIDMGEKGQSVLNILGRISEWNELVDLAREE
jgi:hypothetical protein